MPVIESAYKPLFLFKNGFISTVYSGLVRRISIEQQRERITLKDGDFLDLDWSFADQKTSKLIILLHGLEGNGQRPYMTGAAKLFNENGVDAVCVNFRGCSGEDNLKFSSYHSGATEDLDAVIKHAINTKNYSEIYLKGISLGANIILKYLGERQDVPKQVKASVVVSVPCYLAGSAKALHTFKNRLYHDRFLKHLVKKLKLKQEKYSELLSAKDLKSIKTLTDFDTVYTAKAHGFKSAKHYYETCSSLQFLPHINIPTLIINALNDSFLSPECYPVKEAKQNKNIHLEMPKHGGHAGFVDKKNVYYNERKALDFVMNY
ncbi:YheT family hydrolase [Flavisericum labens]|uniref:YheT family hydrolase n=1 Tax=Flavisericum labens TaxID=3377112 RepID=UPI00387B3DA9